MNVVLVGDGPKSVYQLYLSHCSPFCPALAAWLMVSMMVMYLSWKGTAWISLCILYHILAAVWKLVAEMGDSQADLK